MRKWEKYHKKYCKDWEKEEILKEWILSVTGGDQKAYCKYCKTQIRAHHGELVSHAKTEKHKRNKQPFLSSRTLFELGCQSKKVDNFLKVTEIKIAAHIACHSSLNTVDHLGELFKDVSGKDVKLHTTKCTALIKCVLGPAMLEQLLQELADIPYSLIIDESTDIGNEKQLCIMVKYYSAAKQQIFTSFLGLLSIESGTAEAIFQAIIEFLRAKELDIKQCIGLATDGCNTMCGRNNSVITKFRELCPNIIHIRCICHSIQLCSSHALKVMPRNVELMVSETYNWFSHSTSRQRKYRQIYSAINVEEAALKILKLSDTRWLSISACVDRILQQFDGPKLHFQLAKDEDRNYTAELLFQMYGDMENKLYLIFLQPILKELNRVNKLFQSDSANPLQLLTDVMMALAESNLTFEKVDVIKSRCQQFLVELLRQMKQRLPCNVELLESIADLSPTVVTGKQKRSLQDLSFLPLFSGDLGKLDQQYSRIGSIQWIDVNDQKIEQFWFVVINHVDASGDHDFQELGSLALSILALPFSNAAVERAFSLMALLKSKLRNRMGQSLLENLLHVKSYMATQKICCNNFTPWPQMISRFTSEIYESTEDVNDAIYDINV
ncbi:uncharacterized protein LOC124435111 [Xenia sp. Carnegie-2017]|uniref:uncharacterized protein LOC124435111 n=1 Tax=Xenia sp. Carnegie-2017 TaxID=2897299 RepID=UPI001F033AEF|nr:uncharacterized protein LOC124435111 [Xenia sp. Carnegie-2017]